MKQSFVRGLGVAFVVFVLMYVVVFRPAHYGADYADAEVLSYSKQVSDQDTVLRLKLTIEANRVQLDRELAAQREVCSKPCSVLEMRGAELEALRSISQTSQAKLTDRSLSPDGAFHASTVGSVRASLLFLDGLRLLPMPVRVESASLSAQDHLVRMDVVGTAVTEGS
jgi:hypothetical protein